MPGWPVGGATGVAGVAWRHGRSAAGSRRVHQGICTLVARRVLNFLRGVVEVVEVRYSDVAPPQERVQAVLVDGMIGQSVTLPIVVTVTALNVGREPWSTPWGLAALGLVGASVIYLAALLTVQRHRGVLTPPPPATSLVVLLASLVSLTCLNIAVRAPLGYYMPVLLVGVLFTCEFCDLSMRLAALGIAVGLVTVAAWVDGDRGLPLATVVVMYAWIGGIVVVLMGRLVDLLQGIASRGKRLQDLADAMAGAESVTRGLEVGLPLVGGVLPCDLVVVAGRFPSGRIVGTAVWPPSSDGEELLARPELVRAIETDAPVLTAAYCALPVGFGDGAELAMIARLQRRKGDTDLRMLESARALASAMLKMTSRIAFVSLLRREGRIDPLTGLGNRRALLERLQDEMVRSPGGSVPLGLAMIDLDEFKKFNDSYGHVAGDELLSTMAAILAANVRDHDMVARYGGEEFCIVLPRTDVAGAYTLMDRIRCVVNADPAATGVTLSIGVTQWSGLESAVGLIERADRALYEAKQRGRDQVIAAEVVAPVWTHPGGSAVRAV